MGHARPLPLPRCAAQDRAHTPLKENAAARPRTCTPSANPTHLHGVEDEGRVEAAGPLARERVEAGDEAEVCRDLRVPLLLLVALSLRAVPVLRLAVRHVGIMATSIEAPLVALPGSTLSLLSTQCRGAGPVTSRCHEPLVNLSATNLHVQREVVVWERRERRAAVRA